MKRLILLTVLLALPWVAWAQDTPTPEATPASARPAPETPEDFFELAITRFQRGDLAGAERHTRTALALKAPYPEANYLLGRVLLFRAAQKNKLLIDNRGSGGAVLPVDQVWQEGLNDLQESVGQFRTVIRLQPANTDAWLLLATALDNLGQKDEAASAYKQTININPASQNARDAHNNLGVMYMAQGKYREAKVEFETALALDPSFNAARLNLEKLRKKSPKIFKK